MVLISPIYDIGLPPLGVLVLCGLQHWILNRNKRKKSSKNSYDHYNENVENAISRPIVNEIPNSCPEYLLHKKVATSENIISPFFLEKSTSEKLLQLEDATTISKKTSESQDVSEHKIQIYEKDDRLSGGQNLLSEIDKPEVSENLETNHTKDVLIIQNIIETDQAKNDLYKELVGVIEDELVLLRSTTCHELQKCCEVNGKENISSEEQNSSKEIVGGSQEILGDGSVTDGGDGKEVSEMITKNIDECDDAKSQTSAGTNEVSEDSGFDNMDRHKMRESLSKDYDSCISSEDMTLVTENDGAELHAELGVNEINNIHSETNEETYPEESDEDDEVETIDDHQSYTSFFFPKSLVGSVIGKGGSSARDLFDQTGAGVTVTRHNNNLVVVGLSAVCAEDVLDGLMYFREKYAGCISVDFDTVLEETYDVTAMKRNINKQLKKKYVHISHKYNFPSDLIGMLIGKNGGVVNEICKECGVDIDVETRVEGRQIIIIAGLPEGVKHAKSLIEEKFEGIDLKEPLPQPSLKRFPILRTNFLIPNESMESVRVSSVLSPSHIFVHRTILRSNHNLKTFSLDLNKAYANGSKDSLPHPIRLNTLCVVEHDGSYYRAVTTDCRRNETSVMFADYGGEKVYKNSELHVIRNEFVDYCFQAVECFLDGVSPISGQGFPMDAVMFMRAELANKELVMRTLFTDSMGRTHVELYGKKDDGKELLNIAVEAASLNLVSYNPSLVQ